MESKTDRQERIPAFHQNVIRNTRVAVIGAGATGNEVLKCLALTGFGYVYLADMDIISTSNLSRTVLFSEKDVGKSKAVIAAKRFCDMNIIDGKADFLNGDLCHRMGDGVLRHVDLVIGCLDNEQTRLFVSHLCQLLKKPYIDTGIGGFNWNVFCSSGQRGSACYACTMSQRQEERALHRIRNSCDVTRREAAEKELIPTIGISAAAAAALAVQEAIKACHHLADVHCQLPAPRYAQMSCFLAENNELRNIRFPVRRSCQHHDTYEEHGGIRETPMSAHWTLKRALTWVREQYGREYTIALYKDSACTDRSFVTEALCKHCGKKMDVYRPQPLQDEDLLCDVCRKSAGPPLMPSNAVLKSRFDLRDEQRLQNMTLLELGIPLLHILEFAPVDDMGMPLYLELTGDLKEVMPNLM